MDVCLCESPSSFLCSCGALNLTGFQPWRADNLLIQACVAQGIEIVRRDNCLLVRNVVTTCLEMILIKRDEEGAKAYVRRTIADLLMNRLDLSLLVVTKACMATFSMRQCMCQGIVMLLAYDPYDDSHIFFCFTVAVTKTREYMLHLHYQLLMMHRACL